MTPERFYDNTGKMIGTLNELQNEIKAYNSEGKLVGSYDKRLHATYGANGQRVSSGNTVTSLFTKK